MAQGSMSGRRKNVAPRGLFWVAAFSFLSLRLSLVGLVTLVGYGLYLGDEADSSLLLVGVGACLAILIVCGLVILTNQRKVSCPLCRASLFMSQRGLVKPAGKKFCGCAKTPLACSLLTMPEVLDCPYCAERVRLTRSS